MIAKRVETVGITPVLSMIALDACRRRIDLLHAIDGVDYASADRFGGQIIPLQLTFAQRSNVLNTLGAHVQGRVVLTEDVAAGATSE